MPRVNVYLPDDLHNEVKAAHIEISAVCQSALREAVAVKEQGVGMQLEALQAALRLRRTTPPGRHDIGAIDGARWARETATAKDLQTIDRLTVRASYSDPDADGYFDVLWDWDGDEDATGANFVEPSGDFDTLFDYLCGSGYIGSADDTIDADERFQGFVEAAQKVWHELKPLVDEDEAVLQRRIGLLQRMEHNMLVDGQVTDNAVAAEPD